VSGEVFEKERGGKLLDSHLLPPVEERGRDGSV